MAQEVSGRSLIAKTQVRPQANQCAICDGLSDLEHVFIRVLEFILTVIIAPVPHLSQTLHNTDGWLDKLWEAHF